MPITSIAAIHYAKRETCPNMQFANDFNLSSLLQDQSTVAHVSTKGVYDSRKDRNEFMSKLDWKILTLKEIKGLKGPAVEEPKVQECQQKGNRKIFVSISKSNRSSASKERKSGI
jgi:hypothetical protein